MRLTPRYKECASFGERLWVGYHAQRTLMTFRGLVRLRLVVRRCRTRECALYHVPYRAEEEGAWALPHGEFGLDIITVIGQLRYGERRASGRRGAIAGLVVPGPARVLTALARRKQLRFRKDPAAYLAALEDILLKTSLPS